VVVVGAAVVVIVAQEADDGSPNAGSVLVKRSLNSCPFLLFIYLFVI
jgi:hypothetical protein